MIPNPATPSPPYPPGIESLNDILTYWNTLDDDTINESIEDAVTALMKNDVFTAQERQINTCFKGVLNTAMTNNLEAATGSSGPLWKNIISKTIDNPGKTDFGRAMLNVLYPDPGLPEINPRDLGRDLLLIMETDRAVLFDTLTDILRNILNTDMDEATKESLRQAIADAAVGTGSILDDLNESDRKILKRVLNEAVAKADAKSNEAPLFEAVAAALYDNNDRISQSTYTEAVIHVLGDATKTSLNATIRTAIDTQTRVTQEKIVDEGIRNHEDDIEGAITNPDNNGEPQEIAEELKTHTGAIMKDATTGLLTEETQDLVSLAVQLATEQTTWKTIGRQGIAEATQTALENMLSQQLIDTVAEEIQLGIIEDQVTAMPVPQVAVSMIFPPPPIPGDKRRPVVKDIIAGAMAKVTQQTLTPEAEELLITYILIAIDMAKAAINTAISTVTGSDGADPGTVTDEAKLNTDETLEEIITLAQTTSETAAQEYCHHQLFMGRGELTYVLQDRFTGDDEAWERCYVILEDANKDKIIQQGKEVLEYKREEGDKITPGRGFQDISEYCWGDPTEEDPIPPMPEGADTLDDVYHQLQDGTTEEQEKASDYIRNELYLDETGFSRIMDVKNDTRATEADWDEVYGLMEPARMKKREIVIPEPQKELYGNLYATPDVSQTAFRKDYEDETTDLRWKTFGANALDEENQTVTFAGIGFAVSSSVLVMEQGRRSITWTIGFEPDGYDEEDLEALFANGNTTSESETFPFDLAVTTAKQWIAIAVNHVRYGVCITRDPEKSYNEADVTLSPGNTVTKSGGDDFIPDDTGGFLVWSTGGAICRIDSVVHSNEAQVTPLAETLSQDQRPKEGIVKKYGPEDLYFQALQFELSVDDKEDPIAIPDSAGDAYRWPVLKMLLRNIRQAAEIQGMPDYYINCYNTIQNLKLHKTCVKVSVADLNEFHVSNDTATLKSTGPFLPFDSNPEANAAVYFAHTETAYKQLDTLQIDIEWKGAPEDFKTHYESYWRVDGIKDYPYLDNAGYTAQLKFNDRSIAVPLESFDYTETFSVREAIINEAFLLSGTPIDTATTADFKAEGENSADLPVVDYKPDITSQYIVINTEGRSIGDSFTVTYFEDTPPEETLNVHKIGDRVTFYLKDGIKDNLLRPIEKIEWDAPNEYSIREIKKEDSGAYQSAKLIIDTTSEFIDTDIRITYPASGAPYLFSAPDATNPHTIGIRNLSDVLKAGNAAYQYARDNSLYTEDDVREWARFWELSLKDPDFYHKDYNRLLTKQQRAPETLDENGQIPNEIKNLILNEPYTPEIRKMVFSYTALAAVEAKTYQPGGDDDLLLYVHPFGFSEIYPSEETGESEDPIHYFFPEYKDEGQLYIGIEQMETPTNLSLLFQMAEGSADPDLPKANVQWSYLSDNLWIPLGEENIPYDHTGGLVNTGIITFDLPKEAVNTNTLLPQGLHWLRAAAALNAAAVCDTIAIETQAVNAVLSNPDEVPPDHLTEPLPAGSISRTSEKIAEIQSVNQPYTSDKGKPEEQDADFYVRIGERIRHKNRLLTLWDYERIILEAFPDVYKAKCLFYQR